MYRCIFLGALLVIQSQVTSQGLSQTPNPDELAKQVIARYEAKVKPLEIEMGRVWWEANVTGSDDAFKRKEALQNQLNAALADPEVFAKLKSLEQNPPQGAQLARITHLLYLTYLERQASPELLKQIAAKENAIEKAFNVYRAVVDGNELTDSQVRKVLGESKDSQERRQVWLASKAVGANVEPALKELVKLRNQAAKEVGFDDFHKMRLYLNEQTQADVLKIFDELENLTGDRFAAAKHQMDQKLAKNCGVSVNELMPWHYHDPFFQEPPAVYETNLDDTFKNVDIPAVCRKFYAGIGLPIDAVLAKSDLYEKPGKSPHAFCIDIDRVGDVRVLANIVPNEYWMTTMLHELGHSVYSSRFIPQSLPYVVRGEAHILTTEGMAMMFERLAGNSKWLKAMNVAVENPSEYDETAKQMRRNKLLIFSRWCQVMFRFEKSMYDNPEQDLNQLWWDLVEKYQLLRRPENRSAPDYASKIHIVSAPAYYHNYLLGELWACQLHAAICRDVLGQTDPRGIEYHDDPRIGEYIQKRVFDVGRTLPWNETTRYATGQLLEAKAFARELE